MTKEQFRDLIRTQLTPLIDKAFETMVTELDVENIDLTTPDDRTKLQKEMGHYVEKNFVASEFFELSNMEMLRYLSNQ